MALVTPRTFDPIYGVKEALICNSALARIGVNPIIDTDEDTKQSVACKAVYSNARDRIIRSHPFNFCVRSALIPYDEDYAFSLNGYAYAYKAENRIDFTGTNDTDEVITAIPEDDEAGGLLLDDTILGKVVFSTTLTETGALAVQENSFVVGYDATLRTITLDRPTLDAVTSFTIGLPIEAIWLVGSNKDNRFEVFGGGANQRVFANISSDRIDGVPYLDIKYSSKVIDPDLFDDAFKDALIVRIAYEVCLNLTKNGNLYVALGNEFRALLSDAKISSAKEKQKFEAEEMWTSRSGEPYAMSGAQ